MAEPWTAEDMRGIEVDELLLRIGPLKDCCCTWQAIPCGAHRQASRALDAVLAGRDATLDAVRADRAALLAVVRAAERWREAVAAVEAHHEVLNAFERGDGPPPPMPASSPYRASREALAELRVALADPRVRALLEES